MALGDNRQNAVGFNSSDNSFDSSNVAANENGSILERLEQIQEATNKGTGGALGANRSIVDEINGSALNYNGTNYLSHSIDLSEATYNTVATHELFTVTGLVRARIIAEVTTTGDDTSGNTSTIQLGVESDTDAFIAATEVDDLAGGEIWYDATPTTVTDAFASVCLDKVVSAADIGYEIAGEAATAGEITFHLWWEPLSSTGAVVVGDGSAMV